MAKISSLFADLGMENLLDWNHDNGFRWYTCTLDNNPEKIKETKEEYIIELLKPRLKKENLKVELKEGILDVKYENKSEKLDTFESSQFSTSFSIAKNVRKEDIKVKYEGGVITIRIKKQEPPKPQVVEIPIE